MITNEVYEEQKALSNRWKEMYYEKKNEIDQLTNNWNELEEWLYENESFDDYCNETTFTTILDKMKEIKESDKE